MPGVRRGLPGREQRRARRAGARREGPGDLLASAGSFPGRGTRDAAGAASRALALHAVRTPPVHRVCPVKATQIDREGLVAQVYPAMHRLPLLHDRLSLHGPTLQLGSTAVAAPDGGRLEPGRVGAAQRGRREVHVLPPPPATARATGPGRRAGRFGKATTSRRVSQTCPAEAMVFGDLDDPRSAVARLQQGPRAFRLLEELGTRPKVIYLSKGEWGGEV